MSWLVSVWEWLKSLVNWVIDKIKPKKKLRPATHLKATFIKHID